MLPFFVPRNGRYTDWPTGLHDPAAQLTLDLGFNRIAALPPSARSSHYPRLVTLRLHHNALAAWPADFTAFPCLAELNLSANPLPDPPPDLPSPGKLKVLHLSDLGLSRLPDNWLGSRLTELGLNRNRLTELPASLFTRCPDLEELDLARNRLRTLPPDLSALSRLRELDLSYNQLESLPDNLGDLATLEVLNLQGNRLRALPESLGRLRRLRRLIVHENQLAALPACLGGLTSLEYLDASCNQLCSLPPGIVDCPALAWLVLSQNQLEHLPPDFARLTSLRRAFFTQNQLAEIPPESPATSTLPLPPPAVLELSGNRIPKSRIRAYQDRPPESCRWALLGDD